MSLNKAVKLAMTIHLIYEPKSAWRAVFLRVLGAYIRLNGLPRKATITKAYKLYGKNWKKWETKILKEAGKL